LGEVKVREAEAFVRCCHLAVPSSPFFLYGGKRTMEVPLARKVNGKKFMWDGAVYDSDDQAEHVMEDYVKDGFEVQKFVEDGQFLVYSRRIATAASSG
jgi:hypothetical protein